MKVTIMLLISSWLISKDLDYNHRLFIREIQSAFGVGANQLKEIQVADLQNKVILQGKFFSIDAKIKGYAYIGRVNSCRSGGCSNGKVITGSESEYFDYFILFNEGGEISLIRVFNYQATHGHGITSRGWLRQFTGYEGDVNLEPGKNVDAISGATISAQAITEDIEQMTRILNKYISNQEIN